MIDYKKELGSIEINIRNYHKIAKTISYTLFLTFVFKTIFDVLTRSQFQAMNLLFLVSGLLSTTYYYINKNMYYKIHIIDDEMLYHLYFRKKCIHTFYNYALKDIEQFYVTKDNSLHLLYNNKHIKLLEGKQMDLLNVENLLENFLGLQDYKVHEDEVLEKVEKVNKKVNTHNIWDLNITKLSSMNKKDIVSIDEEHFEVNQLYKLKLNDGEHNTIIHLQNPTNEYILFYRKNMYESTLYTEKILNYYEFEIKTSINKTLDRFPTIIHFLGKNFKKDTISKGTINSHLSPDGNSCEQLIYLSEDGDYLRFLKIGEKNLSLFEGRRLQLKLTS
ncbi:hypothetical protein MY04_5018 [Flammeovirga sp. MY04]|uniref:hypothetical protein n=1 Tax=Flammeovirga sp. MY04 TaxID=1191459 RepID=UPI00080610D3|nr:hypothetical protein [Flammeovirga sp. MY04]ANQ52353.1 hypothetical protein MY04_5018 [Flammeovirga sp. MY04]